MPKDVIKVAILHWFPLEQFPPAQNLINTLGSDPRFDVVCCTTQKPNEENPFTNSSVRIRRSCFPSSGSHFLIRLFRFLSYPWLCLFTILWQRPAVLIYYEPHSAPAAFLSLMLWPRCKLLIHYHEYRDPQHFLDRGNSLARLGHWFEKRWLFRKAEWISHTNQDRIRLFLDDCPEVSPTKMHALPNLPPQAWIEAKDKKGQSQRDTLRLVYIGAISLHDCYLEPLLRWFEKVHPHNITLDLFINNVDPATKSFLAAQNQKGLTIHLEGVPYNQLPTILPAYDIGLILYRCNSTNYVYNAPNKLFEYLACGLNVIYPTQMLGVSPYARSECSPWVKSIDFENLEELTIEQLKSWSGPYKPWEDSCEKVYRPLLDQMLGSKESE